ncbi:calcium-binding protein [Vibrio alginolyticus]|uniref:calcium-binding protein n=1 Tax=Vibrio sp. B1FLJ16 TaxID=2751178 RepID=UPI0015F6B58C|nr:calcium-binding protein [Vibrio sp. B1FLJ16]CAD7817215.1 Haemolysin-type calcium-binding repeat (2 copies) [Vibrio sp. B1FLJ16]CAE6930448.1 Haemolysin-type calcium-binding repeat (2 copies) [Vibrio sp. B1FLJ16]
MSASDKTVETTYLSAQDNLFANFEGTDDVIVGLAGNDTIIGGGGDDLIIGGAGDDRLVGGAGDDVLRAGTGNDYLGGGSGDDILLGLLGDNILNGGVGNDTLIVGSGDNVLVGGSGSDKFIFTDKFGEGHGEAKVVDFTIGEDSLYISSSSVSDFSDLEFSYDAAGNAVFTDGADLTVKLIGITEADINTYGADLFVI